MSVFKQLMSDFIQLMLNLICDKRGGGGSISIVRFLAVSGIRPTGCGRPLVLEREGQMSQAF